MKFIIKTNLKYNELVNQVPQKYFNLIKVFKNTNKNYDFLLFLTADNDFVNTSNIKKAMINYNINNQNMIIICGQNFTKEACDEINKVNGNIVSLHDHYWTD